MEAHEARREKPLRAHFAVASCPLSPALEAYFALGSITFRISALVHRTYRYSRDFLVPRHHKSSLGIRCTAADLKPAGAFISICTPLRGNRPHRPSLTNYPVDEFSDREGHPHVYLARRKAEVPKSVQNQRKSTEYFIHFHLTYCFLRYISNDSLNIKKFLGNSRITCLNFNQES